MRRLYVLVARALRFNEPVLLVGETGSGKTSVCQAYAEAVGRRLQTVNCHQNTETADLLGGLRPIRNRAIMQHEAVMDASVIFQQCGVSDRCTDEESILALIERMLHSSVVREDQKRALLDVQRKLQRTATIFDWCDGPLVESMQHGDIFLLDEISLADDSVLERMNSVLEPARTIVLAERSGDEVDQHPIAAHPDFKLLSTMNPGGDYGKKELSPALRNRFTEIWVPAVDRREDLEQIIGSMWRHEQLRPYTGKLLDFVQWLTERVGDRSVSSMRDILVRDT